MEHCLSFFVKLTRISWEKPRSNNKIFRCKLAHAHKEDTLHCLLHSLSTFRGKPLIKGNEVSKSVSINVPSSKFICCFSCWILEIIPETFSHGCKLVKWRIFICICYLPQCWRRQENSKVGLFSHRSTIQYGAQFSTTKNVNLYFLPWNNRKDLKFQRQLASAFSLHI